MSRHFTNLQMGLTAIGGVHDFLTSGIAADMAESMRAFNNTMSALAASNANNVTTLNEISVQEASVRASLTIQRQAIIAEGQAEVASGAAGVQGQSVRNVMRGIRSSAARAQFARTTTTRNQLIGFGQERRNIAVSKAMNKDISVIPRPSAVSSFLGIGLDVLETWDNAQPPSEQIFNRLK